MFRRPKAAAGLPNCGVVVWRATGGMDAIDEYSRRLVAALCAAGMETRYTPDGLGGLLCGAEPAWVLLQYNPFRYGRSGFAPRLLRDVARLRHRWCAPLAVMVHEAWIDMTDAKSTLIGLWQHAQLGALLRVADAVMTSTQALADEIGRGAVHVPVAANITPVATSRTAARDRLGLDGRLAIALFGRDHPARKLDYAEVAIGALAEAHGANRLAVLNLGAGATPLRVPAGIDVHSPGELPADELSRHLWASDVVLLPLADGLSTRRTTMMAALAHGRPVLGLAGQNTDAMLTDEAGAVALTPVGDPAAFSRAAVELTNDPLRMRELGDAGRRLYESRFDWPVISQRVVSVIEDMARNGAVPRARSRAGERYSDKPRTVMFVAHDVGGAGGMERVSEQLVTRLLDAGASVVVVARTCSLAKREGLRFVRVPMPSRPFTLAYPAFFAVASVIIARLRADALLHTTGAIVANRTDVSTVHYCHRAAAAQVRGSRASRAGVSYRINAAVAVTLSLAGEAWCYRPARARLLCAVSGGVATELVERFPAMAGSVRTVQNGVDTAIFRADAAARREVRAELGVDEQDGVALFVGGDWERKGLRHAVEALTFADDWHLAVAGAGNPDPLLARARAAGTESRLHFLGTVRELPRLYAAGDAFVLPTAYETFSLVTYEAAASELPLLVTRVNGVEDLLEDGRNGWFIAQDARDIARRLNALRSEPELAHAMAERARAAANAYSWQAMADGYRSLYAELTGRSLDGRA